MQPVYIDRRPTILDPAWRPIPGFDQYICNSDGEVYNLKRKSYLRSHQANRRSQAKSYTLWYDDGSKRKKHICVRQLIKEVWPEYGNPLIIFVDDVEYRQLPEWQNYYIAQDGTLINHDYNDREISTTWHGDRETARISVDQIQITICINDILKELWNDESLA